MMRGFGRYLALIALLATVVAMSAASLSSLDRETGSTATLSKPAVRVIGYQVFPDRGPSFQLEGTRLKLVSNAVVENYDPQRISSYGFRLTARIGDREVWRGEVYTQSRESKAGWDGVRWKHEAAWGVQPIALADERILILDLPPHVATAKLSFTLLGAPREAVVRLFRQEPRTLPERQATYRRLDASERDELVRSSTYVPWQLLSAQEQDARLSHRWLRMAALGDSGFDVTTRTIYVTDFRVDASTTSIDGIEIARGRDAAINVQGPAQISLTALTGSLGEVDAALVSASGMQRVTPDAWGRFQVGAEPATLIVRTDRVEPMRVKVFGPSEAQIAPENVRPLHGELGPDRVRVPLVVVGPSATVTVPVRSVARMPLLGSALRIDARVVIRDARVATELALSPLTITYVASSGRKLRVDRVFVGGPISTFEQVSASGSVARVSEPTSLRAVAPPGAVRLELTADRDVALRMYRWAPGPEVVEPTYRALAIPEFRWRYARLVERSWFPLQATAAAVPAVATSDGTAAAPVIPGVELDAQVRLEPLLPSETRISLSSYQALVPEGHPEQQRAREPVPADELAEVLTAWPNGSVTKLTPRVERRIHFRETIASRPRVSWSADPSALGSEMVVTVDATAISVPVSATVGAVDLPRIPPGVHRVVVNGAIREAWIDRPPSEPGEGVARDRRLYRLTDRLRVRVSQPPQDSVHVYAIIYAPSPAASSATSFVMTIDGGRVVRRTGISDKLTNAELRTTMPAARRTQPALLVDLQGQSAGVPRSIGVGMLSDLTEATHTVELSRIGGEDVWVRFVTTRPTSVAPAQMRTWTSRTSPAVEAADD